MKIATLLVFFAALASGVASAATGYTVNLRFTASVAGAELKPGDYKLTVEGATATIRNAKGVAEAQVTPETVAAKYKETLVHYRSVDGKQTVEEIDLGGTNTRLLFTGPSAKGTR